MSLGAVQCGKAIAQSADELTRIWRLARAASRPDIFPGLLDGIMTCFFTRAGQLVAAGMPPERVWDGLEGAIRWSPRAGTRELTSEWALAMEVLTAACESLDADGAVGQWLARAIAAAEKGTAAIADGSAPMPDGVLVIHILGELKPPRRARHQEPGP